MIKTLDCSVFESNSDILVNTINCCGVMRAGIALEFSLRYPQMYEQYVADCNDGKIRTGKTYLYEDNNQKILNFPTKEDYMRPSKTEYIENGLKYFSAHYEEYKSKSIAFPLLGCTNGGLNYERDIKDVMHRLLEGVNMDVFICTNDRIGNGLEFKMLECIKNIDTQRMLEELNIEDFDSKLLQDSIRNSSRFWSLSSKKATGGVDNYIKIWKYVRSKLKI